MNFFYQKKYFFLNLLVFDFFSIFDLVCAIDTEAEMTATDGDVWTEQVLSGKGPTYNWPYGTRALIAERKRVEEMRGLHHLFVYGTWVNHINPNIFKCPLSFEECFVRSDTQRITLMDRLRTYYNFNWKRDATERMGLLSRNQQGDYYKRQFRSMKREADQLFAKRIEDVLLLQGLTEELKPETLELVKRCTDFQQLLRCMLDAKNESA